MGYLQSISRSCWAHVIGTMRYVPLGIGGFSASGTKTSSEIATRSSSFAGLCAEHTNVNSRSKEAGLKIVLSHVGRQNLCLREHENAYDYKI